MWQCFLLCLFALGQEQGWLAKLFKGYQSYFLPIWGRVQVRHALIVCSNIDGIEPELFVQSQEDHVFF